MRLRPPMKVTMTFSNPKMILACFPNPVGWSMEVVRVATVNVLVRDNPAELHHDMWLCCRFLWIIYLISFLFLCYHCFLRLTLRHETTLTTLMT